MQIDFELMFFQLLYLLLVACQNRTVSKLQTKMEIFSVTCLMCQNHLGDMGPQWMGTYFVEGSVVEDQQTSNKTAFTTIQANFFMAFYGTFQLDGFTVLQGSDLYVNVVLQNIQHISNLLSVVWFTNNFGFNARHIEFLNAVLLTKVPEKYVI